MTGRIPARRLWPGAAAGAVLILIGAPALNRYEYGSYNLWSAPERLQYCGARFYRFDAGPRVATYGDGAVVTKAEALDISRSTTLVAHGSTGAFGQWPVFLPDRLACPQDPVNDQLAGYLFIALGPDRYLELTDAD